ncbi:DoxX-like family protein [Sorangium sp. So ce128]|uniref:DoxX-like family protein n=1 Tax=Sorangium sp. So ce128 TaxID=3133281 RepID=UPI003F5D951B
MQSDCTSSLTERALSDEAGLPRLKRLGLPRRSTKKASYRIAVPYWRLAYRLQIALMLAYMAIISVILPMAWLAPPGEVTKNLPLLAATWLLLALEPGAAGKAMHERQGKRAGGAGT